MPTTRIYFDPTVSASTYATKSKRFIRTPI
jgi:hypothetical protein